jgi:PIN domain nuclease of toxin-antitoxin system
MLRVIADTHALIWYLFSDVRLSPTALAAIQAAIANGDQIGFSVISDQLGGNRILG